MANLAAMLATGQGVTNTHAARLAAREEAYRWAERAAAGGHTKAAVLLGDFTRDGTGILPDAEAAAWMYRRVAERAPALGLVLRQALEWQMVASGALTNNMAIARE